MRSGGALHQKELVGSGVITFQLLAPCHTISFRSSINTMTKKVSFLSILLPLEHSCPHEQTLTSNSSQIFIFQHLMLFIYRTVLSLLLLQRQPWLPPYSSPSASIGSHRSLPSPHLKEDGGVLVPTRCPLCSAPCP